jgi:hypothetical protein
MNLFTNLLLQAQTPPVVVPPDASPLSWLLQQAPVVVVMGLALYVLWKDNKSIRKEAKRDRESHAAQLKELNDYSKSKELEHLATLKDVVVIMDQVTEGQNKTQDDFAAVKDLVLGKIDDLKNYIIDGKGRI